MQQYPRAPAYAHPQSPYQPQMPRPTAPRPRGSGSGCLIGCLVTAVSTILFVVGGLSVLWLFRLELAHTLKNTDEGPVEDSGIDVESSKLTARQSDLVRAGSRPCKYYLGIPKEMKKPEVSVDIQFVLQFNRQSPTEFSANTAKDSPSFVANGKEYYYLGSKPMYALSPSFLGGSVDIKPRASADTYLKPTIVRRCLHLS